jgi:Xaa-Pro aminopeptidase
VKSRLLKLYIDLEKNHLDSLLVTSQPNISYLTGFSSRDSYLLISFKKSIFITDFRYLEETKQNLKNFDIELIDSSLFKCINRLVKKLKLRRLGFEAKNLNFAEYQNLKKVLPPKTEFIPTYNLVESLRLIKDKKEIDKIKKAIQISIKTFGFIKSIIKPGIREIDLSAEIERFIRRESVSQSPFPIIVASGPRSCLPHALTSKRIIKDNEPVLVDLGVDFEGYKSNLTRCFFLGKMTNKFIKVYNIVLEAQKRALGIIREGIVINKIDKIARNFISENGFGRLFFGHNLGHGIGLEVHEEPAISSKNNNKTKEGMVFTIEPAVYIPKEFGVRIEDIVLVRKGGLEVLSGALHKSIEEWTNNTR